MFLLSFQSFSVFADCSRTTCEYIGDPATATTTWQFVTGDVTDGDSYDRYDFYLTNGYIYEFSLCAADGGAADYDSYLCLYGYGFGCNQTVFLATNDDACGTASKITFTSTQDGWVSLYVSGYGANFGNYTLAYRYSSSGCTAPANETCATATSITYAQISAGFNTSGTLGCADNCAGIPYYDTFFRYDCTCTGDYTFDMRNSNGDTYMIIWSGSCCGTQLASDDDSYGDLDPTITVTLTAGNSYWIECGSYSSTGMENSAFNLYASTTCTSGPCASVTAMTCGTTYTGTLLPTGSDWNSYTDCAWGAGDEVVYSFTATTSGNLHFRGELPQATPISS